MERLVKEFASREAQQDVSKANWYTIAAVALAAASAGPDVTSLYQIATQSLAIDEKKMVQRRLKEAILKTSILYGAPRSLQALLPLFATLKEDEIDHFGPRWNSLGSAEATQAREKRSRKYFDIIWGTPETAQANRDQLFKFQPDLYLLNLKNAYEWYISEDGILSPVETQMCTTAALICSNCPVQAVWHARGIIRQGGSMEQARFAQDLGLAIAKLYGCKTGEITKVDDIDLEDTTPH